MNRLEFAGVAGVVLVLGVLGGLFAPLAWAGSLSLGEYKAGLREVSARYGVDKSACKHLAGNLRDVCVAQARGKEQIARAELELALRPSTKHQYDLLEARASAAFAVAKERCDDFSGQDKVLCRHEARGAYISSRADARLAERTADASEKAREKTTAANAVAREETMAARDEAQSDKRDAREDIAREKCKTLADAARDSCLAEMLREQPPPLPLMQGTDW